MTSEPPRSPTNNRFAAVGRCIYCGSIQPPLTDEHIIPEGLGGREILPAASCKICEAITGRFEQMVMRHTVWPLRQLVGMKGRKRKIPSHIPAKGIHPNGETFVEGMKHRDIWLKAVLPVFHEPPGVLIGKSPSDQVGVNFDVFFDAACMGQKQDPGGIIDIKPEWFARMLAKIAHARAVAEYGLDGFDRYLPPIIVGGDTQWPHLIGRASIEELRPEPGVGHWVFLYPLLPPNERVFLARIRLFAALGGPIYDVVTGRLSVPT
jgi:hypothetical protein